MDPPEKGKYGRFRVVSPKKLEKGKEKVYPEKLEKGKYGRFRVVSSKKMKKEKVYPKLKEGTYGRFRVVSPKKGTKRGRVRISLPPEKRARTISMPYKLWLSAVENLSVVDLLNLCRTSPEFSDFCKKKYLWKFLLKRDFGVEWTQRQGAKKEYILRAGFRPLTYYLGMRGIWING